VYPFPFQAASKLTHGFFVQHVQEASLALGSHLRHGLQDLSFEAGPLGDFEAAQSGNLHIEVTDLACPAAELGEQLEKPALLSVLVGNDFTEDRFQAPGGRSELVDVVGLWLGRELTELPIQFLEQYSNTIVIERHKFQPGMQKYKFRAGKAMLRLRGSTDTTPAKCGTPDFNIAVTCPC
jgi:hypothetical protein